MRDYIISTDSTADLPEAFVREHGIAVHPLYYYVDEVQFGGSDNMELHDFYDKMRNGSTVSTSASNPEVIGSIFENQIKEGFDVLHISFSSGLSCSYNNAAVSADEICEKYPEARIEVIDSLCASMGQGLLVYYAVKMKEEGHSLDEVAEWINTNRLHICHQFTVDDLKYLWHGGRISRTVAILGTLINVKPVLHVDNEGHLIPLSNVRGRKKSLSSLVENMAERIGDYKNDIVFISHGDCEDDAKLVADMIREKFGIDSFMFNCISPTIGAHSGPGTIALFHLGTER